MLEANGNNAVLPLRKTKSICPHCLRSLEASIVAKGRCVYLVRECLEHGRIQELISSDVDAYRQIYQLYEALGIPGRYSMPHDRFTLYTTTRCNMACPICVVNADAQYGQEIPIARLIEVLKKNSIKRKKISLFGGEPTVRNDLPELIAAIRRPGNTVTLFTNGIRLADYSYLKSLKENGVKDIYLQFDGFDRGVEQTMRGGDWLDQKLQALENMRRLDMPVVLEVTTSRQHNLKEIKTILQFALRDSSIRGICFRSYSMFGRKKLMLPRLLVDDIIEEINQFTSGRTTKEEANVFAKLLFVIAYLFHFKCCFTHRYIIFKKLGNGHYKTMSEYFDIRTINKRLCNLTLIMKKNKLLGTLYIIFVILPGLITLRSLPCLFDFGKILMRYRFGTIFSNSSFGKSYLIIEIDSPCDRLTVELDRVCNSGAIMEDGTILPSFYDSSLRKERAMSPGHFS